LETIIPPEAEVLQAWRDRVRANGEQAERFREGGPAPDFYAPVSTMFKADPRRTDDPALEVLKTLVQPGDRWLDIGAGGGRYALPLALKAAEVIAVEPSEGMLSVLKAGIAELGITNIRVIQDTWPMADLPAADVALISHISYDIAEIGPFLAAMESSASRMCVAVLVAGSPPVVAAPFWPPIHGEERVSLPGLAEFLALLLARCKLFDVTLLERESATYAEPDGALTWLHMQLFIQPDSEKGRRLAQLARAAVTERNGRWALDWSPAPLGIVRWRP
jgi:SAM-dependent methyltransferase